MIDTLDINLLEKKLKDLLNLYLVHWEKACRFENADLEAISVEFSEGNKDAIICVELMKEIFQIRNTLNMFRPINNVKEPNS